jgi:NodT family efflux transporter outer membrane factor (OMF) lipoprotein
MRLSENIRLAMGIVACSLVVAGCAAVGPDYTPVTPDAPPAWHSGLAAGLGAGEVDSEALSHWWMVLKDPQLETLETKAVTGNLVLKTALSRVREARALRGIRRAERFPLVDTSASATKSRSVNFGEDERYAAGIDAGWELDIFGGLRRQEEAAEADLEASRADLRDVLVSLTAEVGLNYIEVRTLQARLSAARENLSAQQKTYDLNASRYQAGLIDELAVRQSLYNLERTRSRIPPLETQLAAAMNRLAVLLGEKPGALEDGLTAAKPIPTVPVSIAVGVPADALRRRPDIRRAERELAAQTARIGVATADLYPKFRLDGSIGLESLTLEHLPEWASRIFSIGPSASWNLFDAGAIRRNIEVQNARQEQALFAYQTAVLNALEEVENSLMAFARQKDRLEALTRATEAAQQAARVARDRYGAGLVDFSNVLDAQQALLSLQDEEAQSRGAVTAELIRLYKALGGGWKPGDDHEIGHRNEPDGHS